MNFCSAKLCGFGVPLLECWHMLGWEPKRHTYEVYAFHWCHWFTWKLLPVGCALEMCNTSCFGFSSTHVRRNLENVSWQESPVPDIYGFVTNSVEICCIQRELWYIFRCYKKWSLCFTIHLKPPMHWLVTLNPQLKGSVKEPNISVYFFFRPSLNGVLFPMFCLLVEGECQIFVLKYY